jgi:indolepyruvate ferredoxin oxidoreductase
MPVFKVLKRLRFLRGTAFDPFGHTEERRMERALIGEYEDCVGQLLAGLTAQNHALAVQIASLPEEMRGFGYIKKRNVEATRKKRDELLARFAAAPTGERAAA